MTLFTLTKKSTQGFTLIEMIIVIVLLGVMSGVLTPFISKAMQAYGASKARADLVSKGRLAMERMAREIRHAVPNSLRVIEAGAGIEFVRSRAGGRYVTELDDFGLEFSDTARRFKKNVAKTELYVLGTNLTFAANDVLVIGNTTPALLEAGTSTVALTGISLTTALADDTIKGQVLAFSSNTFTLESPGKHFVIADQTVEVGLDGTDLRWYTVAGVTQYDNAKDFSSADPLLINGAAITFTYSSGSPSSSGVLRIEMTITDGATGETIQLYHEVQMRNSL